MQEIILSICIPTYNGGKRLEKLVRHILTTDRRDIEIVINDNCSSDNTMKMLEDIGDERIHVYKNEKNLGALENAVCALKNGHGKYLMLTLDRDVVQPEYIDEYVEFLKGNDYGVVLNMCRQYDKKHTGQIDREAKYYNLVKQPHPSYFTFRKSDLEKIELTREVIENGDYSAVLGIGIAQNSDVFLNTMIPISIEAERQYISMHKSRSWNVFGESNLALEIASFDHESYMGRFETYIHYAMGVCNTKEMNYAINGMYAAMIENSMGYIHGLESTRTKHRYNVPDRHYSMEDYIGIADKFYERFMLYTQKYELKVNINVIQTITDLSRLQFINDTVSQLESMYHDNCSKIEELKSRLMQEGICYLSKTKEDDIIFKEGIHNEPVAVNTVV